MNGTVIAVLGLALCMICCGIGSAIGLYKAGTAASAAIAEDEKKFNPSVYEDAKEDISEAGAVLGTTERETVVFANILEQSCNRHLGMDDVAKEMGITYIKSMTYEAELSSLERKKLIRRNEDEEILVPTLSLIHI